MFTSIWEVDTICLNMWASTACCAAAVLITEGRRPERMANVRGISEIFRQNADKTESEPSGLLGTKPEQISHST